MVPRNSGRSHRVDHADRHHGNDEHAAGPFERPLVVRPCIAAARHVLVLSEPNANLQHNNIITVIISDIRRHVIKQRGHTRKSVISARTSLHKQKRHQARTHVNKQNHHRLDMHTSRNALKQRGRKSGRREAGK